MHIKPEVAAKLEQIVSAARAGHEIIPAFFQPIYGRSNAVSAAIRMALKAGLIEIAGLDGCGKPKYRATAPKATHTGNATVN